MNVTIRGQRWRIVNRKIPDKKEAWALCSPETRLITIDSRAPRRKHLELLLHEILHAVCFDLGEQCVSDYGRDAARILKRLGYSNERQAKDGSDKDEAD